MQQDIGKRVKLASGKRFASGFKTNTIKGIVGNNYVFREDDSQVPFHNCRYVEKIIFLELEGLDGLVRTLVDGNIEFVPGHGEQNG
jgi:hypothetical protein